MQDKNRNSIRKAIEKQTDMPPISLSDLSFIEVSGDRHIELDGIRKILQYRDDIVAIKFKHMNVIFKGENIVLTNFSGKTAIIEGKIRTIEFE